MHMSDALVSPAVAASMWAATTVASVASARALGRRPDDRRVPLMGVLGAFVFAAQMVNFSIPGTGSSGHLVGGLLLAILLGPSAALLVMASVLAVQALFFGDGGVLALGCNIFNLGVLSSFVAYPFVFAPVAGTQPTRGRLALATVLASVVALQIGSLGVVIETALSQRTSISLGTFLLLMQPIHLAIGVIEGLITAALILFIRDARPELALGNLNATVSRPSLRRLAVGTLLAAAVVAGVLSWFASSAPDGLEWSLARASVGTRAGTQSGAPQGPSLRSPEPTTVLPAETQPGPESQERLLHAVGRKWPKIDASESLSGLAGVAMTLALGGLLAAGLRLVRRSSRPTPPP